MLDILSQGFKKATEKLRGKATLSEENIAEALNDIRSSLLEADVEYTVSKTFLARVKEKALGAEVSLRAGAGAQAIKVNPGDHFIRICQEELENLMGPIDTEFTFPSNRPAKIMLVGLQGTGKTTTVGKLAHFLQRTYQRKPLLVAADIYRPAAAQQLEVLGKKLSAPVYHQAGLDPVAICKSAQQHAFDLKCDTIIFDTAGRLTIDEPLMAELSAIKEQTKPDWIFLVCDAMMGQDAVTTAKAFHQRLGLDGFIMTKLDGDARGGAALSIKEVTGAPIKFLGTGEELERLEVFRPQGLASRILGMGDIVGLMQDFERVAKGDQEDEAMRLLSGNFNLKDFYQQIAMIQNMGSLKDIMAKLPMQHLLPPGINLDDRELGKIRAMIDSMTEKERLLPDCINGSRASRIARGSGRSVKDVQELVKKFKDMRQMMGKLGKNMGGLMSKIPGMKGLSQLNQMRKMAAAAGGGGGLPGMGSLAGSMGGLGGLDAMMPPGFPGMGGFGAAAGMPKKIDRDKLKKARKAAKKHRQKNRKK